jgi:tetratricopeptide (TPR) repeat protein
MKLPSNLLLLSRVLPLFAVVLIAGCSSPEEKAQSYYESGMKFLSQQDYVKAGIEFKNALQNKKDLIGAWRGLLAIETHNNNLQGEVPILQTIVELDPKDSDAKLGLGHLMLLGNAPDKALELANAALALDDRNPNALAFRGAVQLKKGNSVEARRDAQSALDIDPKNAEASLVLAGERMATGDTEGALLILDRPGVGHEDDLSIQLFKLNVLERRKDLKEAEALLRKLMDRYPKQPGFRRALARLYVEQTRYDDAEKQLRDLAAMDPSDLEAGLNVVRFLQQVKGPTAAREELLARINAGQHAFQYQLALADFDFAQGRMADSIQLLQTLVDKARSPEDLLAAQIKLAQIQFNQKKFDVAETLDAAVLRKDGRNIEGLKLKASLLMERGQLDAATAVLRQALDDQPRQLDLMVLLAIVYERSGSIELAEKEFADAIKISNFNVAVGLEYVKFLGRRGDIERAEDILAELTRRSPGNIQVLAVLADFRLARQNWKGAQEVAETIRRMENGQVFSEQIQAAALSGQGNYDASIRVLESVQATAPSAVSLAALVNTLVRAQKLDEAISLLQKTLAENPANAEALTLLGSVQLQKGLPDKAMQSFRSAIERQPKDMAGYQALYDFYIRNKNFDEAEKVVRSGLQQQPDHFIMHMDLASVFEMKGDYEGAIAEYESLLKKDLGSMIVANNLASLLSEYRSDKDSIDRAYSLALMLRKSEIPSFKDTLGWLYYLRGDYKNATDLLEQAATALPNRAEVQYHLGMSYVSTGQMAKASEQFKKALALAPNSLLQQKISAAQKKVAM